MPTTSGNLEAAHRTFADGMASLQRGGGIQVALGATFILVHLRVAQGRLRDAIRTYEQALQMVTEQDGLGGAAELYLGLSELHHEQGHWETARELLQQSEVLSEQASLPGFDHLRYAAKARMKQTEGDLEVALNLLEKAEQLYDRSPIPDVLPLAALKARMWVTAGRLSEALTWMKERDLSVEDNLSYLQEYEHITLAKILIAQYQRERVERSIHEASALLERLLQAAEAGERMGSALEILVVKAIAHQTRGDIASALEALKRALQLAEPEGYVRIFVAEGKPMRDLLRQVVVEMAGLYIQRLLSAFDDEAASFISQSALVTGAELVEPLTPREIEILRLVASGLRNQEIAAQLFISLATVKRHIANAYGKLGVSHRTEAVVRANELNLL